MHLYDFESEVEDRIIARGEEYYLSGRVALLKEVRDNEYEAQVEGSDLYSVDVALDGEGNILDAQCDCPYDLGEYCKHQVAVFLALRDARNEARGKDDRKTSASPDTRSAENLGRPSGRPQSLEKILAQREKDELVAFLLKLSSEYDDVGRRIELEFAEEGDSVVKKSIDMIRGSICENSDRYGIVGYDQAGKAAKGAVWVMEKAYAAWGEGKTALAVDLALCVIRELVDAMQSTDDSDGVFGGEIEEGFCLIAGVVKDHKRLSGDERESVFQRLVAEAQTGRLDGWTHWRLRFFELSAEVVDTQGLRSCLEQHLDRLLNEHASKDWSRYYAEQIHLIRYAMVERLDGKQNAQDFIVRHLQFPRFRELAIERAFERGDYDAVMKLSAEGERIDGEYRGLVSKWKKCRYRALALSGRLEDQRGLAMEFILDGSIEYYGELKKTYGAAEWRTVYPGIIRALEDQKQTNGELYPRILVEEGETQKLLALVTKAPYLVERYYQQLLPQYKAEIYELFGRWIAESSERVCDRSGYRRVCDSLRLLKKAGGREKAAEIKQELLNKYPRRPALKDELSKVKI